MKSRFFNKFFLAVFIFELTSTALVISAMAGPTLKFNDPLPANAFSELYKAINPSVVNISTAVRPKHRMNPNRDPFFDFFEEFYGQKLDPGLARPAQSLGTGFIIEADGLIVTNNHVIRDADEVKVQLPGDKKMYDAKVIGRDDRSDIALIRIDAGKKLPFVTLGASESVQEGDWVAAFGNPFGHSNSITKGIISAKGRSIQEINSFPFLQTDASINPGNSGGPLVNLKGEVIGVNTAIDARAQGVGFAIPIDSVKSLLPQLKEKGKIFRGFLGVYLADMDPRIARELGLKSSEGSLIIDVEAGSPADRAGIRSHDVITKFGEKEIKSSRDLSNAVLDTPVGHAILVEIMRMGKPKKVTVTTQNNEPKEKKEFKKNLKTITGEAAKYELGFKMARLTTSLAEELNIEYRKTEPPVVVDVIDSSPAQRNGVLTGDILLDVNQTNVSSVRDVQNQLRKGANLLRLQRGDIVLVLLLEP